MGASVFFRPLHRAIPRSARPVIAVLVLSAAMAATPASAAARSVRSGAATVVLAYGTYNTDNCLQGPLPTLRIVGAPQHGSVEVGRGSQPNTSPRCPGTRVPGITVIYRSKSGYRGPDRIVVDVETDLYIDGRGSRGDRVTIDLDVK